MNESDAARADTEGRIPPGSDRAIGTSAEDELRRSKFAELIAADLGAVDASAGFVAAVTGPWGSGKTSVLNLVAEALPDDAVVLRFNPWIFSRGDDLVLRFLTELEQELSTQNRKRRLKRVRRRLTSYIEVLKPLSGVVSPRLEKLLGVVGRQSGASTVQMRRDLAAELRQAKVRMFVFVDDLDRLDERETADVMRLVKLVADLPNMVYLLAYDRERVENALGSAGRTYIEKIVQLAHELPEPLPSRLRELALTELEQRLTPADRKLLDEDAWAQVFLGAIASFLHTLRDVKRYANVAPLRLALLRDEVAVQDVLALEALRLFEPGVHSALGSLRPVLTGTTARLDFRSGSAKREQAKREIEAVLERKAKDRDTTLALLRIVFPPVANIYGGIDSRNPSRAWRADRRVADAEILDTYLYTQFGEDGLSTPFIRELVAQMSEAQKLKASLEGITDEQLRIVLDRVRDYEDEFPAGDSAVEAARAFFSRFPAVSDDHGLMPGTWALRFVIDALGRQLSAAERTRLAKTLLSDASGPGARWHLLAWYGTSAPNQADGGTETTWLDEATTKAYWTDLQEEVRTAAPVALAGEDRLYSLLRTLVESDEDPAGRAAVSERLDHDAILLALLSELGRYSDGWSSLSHLVGEDYLNRRVTELVSATTAEELPETQTAALESAAKRVRGELSPDDW